MDVMVRSFDYGVAEDYKYNITIDNKIDVFLNNRKVAVKLLKLLGEKVMLYSGEDIRISGEYRRWRET